MPPRPEAAPPARWLLRGFERYAGGYLRRHFHGIRLLGEWPAVPSDRPLVIYLNHPSWWDPLICLLLAKHCCAERGNYAPIDDAMLKRYAFMQRLGFFGVEQGSRRGAADFLRTSEAILQKGNTSLWLTPQGRFVDARCRPVELASGLSHLMRRMPQAVYLPLALEYVFWTERTPEALACFGTPVTDPGQLASTLEATQDRLAAAAIRRNAAEFQTMLGGAAGEGGIYQAWRRVRSLWQGDRFQLAHGAGHKENPS
ncbi:MAG: lysophospholipid acyltransferase family protein [Verrucomicrobiota bacterium]